MLAESLAAGPIPMENGETPGLACLSPGLVAHDTPPPLESGYGPDDSEDYVLPPLHIDTSPISLQLPLSFCPVQHQLYEAKAPPPVSLPYRLTFEDLGTEAGDSQQTLKQDQDEPVSDAAGSVVPSSILSPSPQLFSSRENSQSSLLDDTSDTSISPCPCPSLSRSPFREESPSPPPSTSTIKAFAPRCAPPRSNAHAAFPSPPPTPEAETLPVFEAAAAFQVLEAPISRRPHLPTRRYLAPAFVRGEVLPFAIAEELEEDEDEVKTEAGAVANSFAESNEEMVNGRMEPETSGSEYSTESAVRLESGGQIVASTESCVHRSISVRSVNRPPSNRPPSTIHRVGSKKGKKRRQRTGLLAMEVHAKRTASGISKFSERMKNFVGINRGLRIRDRI